MDEKVATLRQELPRLIEAAKTLEASVLLMLLTNADKELRQRAPEPQDASETSPLDHP